ncbi:MAG: DUF169 domain-containing protein [Anaerolineales bacterium]|nr:DUF169 domain-containing protein [Anaerolineales bacterium]MCB8965918.1 DUF169 domain-containing protein [Ardenticatenaceae bacterium]
MPEVIVDHALCTGCGTCADFCPVEVFEMRGNGNGRLYANPIRQENCWACDTCVGQCKRNAIQIIETGDEIAAKSQRDTATARPIPHSEKQLYASWHETLRTVLGLRWAPVAIKLIPQGDPLPDVPMPRTKLRYCQSLMMARRGKSLLMPAQCHACPDGTHILGLTEIPPKLASGELYLHFKKLASMDAARQMIAERPRLPEKSMQATLVTPLNKAVLTPDVVAVIAQPEQMMWLTMASSFYTGHRSTFQISGYNAQCVETTLIPYTRGEFNLSLGCYGCRASSDVSDDLMFMGVPIGQMPDLIRGLESLGRKAIPDSRNKVYLPPNI